MTQVKDKKKEESVVFSTKVVEEILHKENMGLKLKNSEKLWLNNMKGVRRPNVPFAMTNDEIGEYLKCKMSIKYFIENYVNIKREDGSIGKISLRDYQNEMIDIMDQNRFSIFMFSRQSGKCSSFNMKLNIKYNNGNCEEITFGELYFRILKQERKLSFLENCKYILYKIYILLS